MSRLFLERLFPEPVANWVEAFAVSGFSLAHSQVSFGFTTINCKRLYNNKWLQALPFSCDGMLFYLDLMHILIL